MARRRIYGGIRNTCSSCRHPRSSRDKMMLIEGSGDSYSSIGYDVHDAHPNATNIIGNPHFPGDTTAGGPNWVLLPAFPVFNNRLVTSLQSSQTLERSYMTLLCPDIRSKASRNKSGRNSCHTLDNTHHGPLGTSKTLFSVSSISLPILMLVTWIGINDGGRGLDPFTQLTLLFDLEESLYGAGARHFVFFTVPPIERIPQSILPCLPLQANTSYKRGPSIKERTYCSMEYRIT